MLAACLMVVAWMAMAGMTVVLSRYFKEGEGAHFCMGSRTWFQVGRLRVDARWGAGVGVGGGGASKFFEE